jgi:hypothetical protein
VKWRYRLSFADRLISSLLHLELLLSFETRRTRDVTDHRSSSFFSKESREKYLCYNRNRIVARELEK